MRLKRLKRLSKETERKIGIVCSLVMYFIYVVLLMTRTKMLITSYGSEVNAIFQTSNQLFSYLVLFESGMSAAYQFRLYEPVSNKNIAKVSSLFKGLKKSMSKIAFKMTMVLVLISIFYPFIMNKVSISVMKAGWMFFWLGVRFVIPYFVSIAKKTLLNVYDYKYLLDNIDSFGSIAIVAAELWAMCVFQWSVYSILLIGCIGNVVIGLIYTFLVKKICVGVQEETVSPNFEPEGMTKDILFHKITGLFNSNIDTIILSVVNINLVTPYHAYYSTMNYFPQIINKINENYRTKIGLKIKQHDQNLYSYFQFMMAFHMIAAIITASMFTLNINIFIYLWIGEEYLLSGKCVILLVLSLILKMIINTIFLVRDGAGLYKESKWFSLWEGTVNLILSIILVRFWGIEGILFATVFATYTMLIPGNARLAYKKVMEKKDTLWIDFLIIIITTVVITWILKRNEVVSCSWNDFIIRLLKQGTVCTITAILVVVGVKWKYISQIIKNDLH